MSKKGQFFSILAIISIISLLLNAYFINKIGFFEEKTMIDYNLTKENFDAAAGYYISNKYYCVWTAGLLNSEIEDTEFHEQCHWLVDKKRQNNQYQHFCGG